MNITDSIYYIGVNDHDIDLFEGQYPVPEGMSYNSYLIVDERIAVMDTVDLHFAEEWLHNLSVVLKGKRPDYLIIQHMEPDHAGSIARFVNAYPQTAIVTNEKAFTMMGQFFDLDLSNTATKIVVENGDTLTLGSHTLTFLFAPMVHWPEVMVTYDAFAQVLFSADAFGKFGANDARKTWRFEDWIGEARRYYIGIVGKYGAQVQSLLKTAANLQIQKICSTHGPILTENLDSYFRQYDIWSSYRPESDGILIAYASMYGNTRRAVFLLESELRFHGCQDVLVTDLARDDLSAAVANAFRYKNLVLATPTYNTDVFPAMREFLTRLTQRNFQNHTVALIENGTWAPKAGQVMRDMLKDCKNLHFTKQHVTILSAPNAVTKEELRLLADELCPGNCED